MQGAQAGCRQGLPSPPIPPPILATTLPKGHPMQSPSPLHQDVPTAAPEGWRGTSPAPPCPPNVLTHQLPWEVVGASLGRLGLGLHPRRAKCLLLAAVDPLLHTQVPKHTRTHPAQGSPPPRPPPRTKQALQTSIKFLK